MGDIYNNATRKVGHVDADGVVWNTSDHRVGRISSDRHILTSGGQRIGRIEHDGRIFDQHDKHVGTVRRNYAFTLDEHRLGHAEEPDAEAGCAALIMLFE